MAIPKLSSEQLAAARASATEARRIRAELKEQVKKQELTFTEALAKAKQDEVLSRIKVIDLLRAVPRVGITRATEILERADIAANRRIRGLGHHQIERLEQLVR
ncbi:integration host factor, actinobacterial type [uncultured Tessaracoccus sp.]|uniref:integration host factor, actinobacterial type n=1 Tax=uncultured Tessaracoccus sp. TaxID=905023 RepID=UPI00260DB325|nr:integration host factor, actinobacterial type [uncultured Tessaracoccus sp.]